MGLGCGNKNFKGPIDKKVVQSPENKARLNQLQIMGKPHYKGTTKGMELEQAFKAPYINTRDYF